MILKFLPNIKKHIFIPLKNYNFCQNKFPTDHTEYLTSLMNTLKSEDKIGIGLNRLNNDKKYTDSSIYENLTDFKPLF